MRNFVVVIDGKSYSVGVEEVGEGHTVAPVVTLEAMKMDNDITAPCDGKITYQVAKGANVESDAVLAVIG